METSLRIGAPEQDRLGTRIDYMKPLARAVLAAIIALVAPATTIAQSQWRVVEDLRIGDDDKALFSDIRGVVAGPTGNIFVLDFKSQEIRMFDAKGAFVRTVARDGSGPGELRNASGMLLAKDGTIWVNDQAQRRWNAYSATDGKFLRQVRLPILRWGFYWQAGIDERGRIIDVVNVNVPGKTQPDGRPLLEQRLRRVDVSTAAAAAADTGATGPRADTVAFPVCAPRIAPRAASFTGYDANGRAAGYTTIPFLPQPQLAFGLDGTLWCSGSDDYIVVHRAIGPGDTLHVIRANYPALPVTAQERTDGIEGAMRFLSRYPRNDMNASLIPATKPIIQRLVVDRTGRVWVYRTQPSTTSTSWEVYDATGQPLATATFGFAYAASRPMFVTNDAVYVIALDADGVPSVVRAKIRQN